MFTYRIATEDDLEKLWEYDINRHQGEEREQWQRWKVQYLEYNRTGKATTFAVLDDEEPIGQITLLWSTECLAVKNHPELCDGISRANMNAFRIKKTYEGQGHISKLVKMAESYAKQKGFTYLTIGSEAVESRNLAIYLHFGYTEFITSVIEDGELILYYGKKN